MNRGDTRLFLTIISTAFVTAVVTLLVSRAGDSPPQHCANSADLATMQERVDELAARINELGNRMAHAAPAEAPPPPAEPPPPCDEVSCVLNNYEGACCAKYKSPHRAPSNLPDSLDRQMISDGISAVKAKVLACGDRSDAKGQVKIRAKVDPDGTPHVEIKQTPDDALGRCVVEAVASARFAKTQFGGSFSYPFVF